MKEFDMANPDEIGSSEYRAIYDCLQDGLEACDADDRQALAEAMLESFIEHASVMLRQIRDRNTQMKSDSVSSSELTMDDVSTEAAQQVVAAIRRFMFESHGRWHWREISGADFIEFVTLLLSQHDFVLEGRED